MFFLKFLIKEVMKKFLLLFFIFFNFQSHSHEIKPAIADLIISDGSVSIELVLNAETVLAELDASKYQDTNNAPEAAIYDQFRSLSDSELQEIIKEQSFKFIQKISTNNNDQKLDLQLTNIKIRSENDLEIPRETVFTFTTTTKNNNLNIQFDTSMGPVVVRQFSDDTKETALYTSYLRPGETSDNLFGETSSSFINTAIEYLVLGMEHIVPKGLDHILFVIGIFFYSIKLRPLIAQVTMFTIAHSLTLVMASLNLIFIPAFIIEPLIALSISYVAFENIFQKKLPFNSSMARYIIICIFGLIHGLGFAFVLGDIGLNTNQLILSLISFNIGVEIAQIGIILFLFILMILPSQKAWYAKFIQYPISALVGLIGLYWFIERVFF